MAGTIVVRSEKELNKAAARVAGQPPGRAME